MSIGTPLIVLTFISSSHVTDSIMDQRASVYPTSQTLFFSSVFSRDRLLGTDEDGEQDRKEYQSVHGPDHDDQRDTHYKHPKDIRRYEVKGSNGEES